jgi:hypothetical protein
VRAETHRCEFDRFAAVHGCQKQVAIPINEQQLAVGGETALVERDLGYLSGCIGRIFIIRNLARKIVIITMNITMNVLVS